MVKKPSCVSCGSLKRFPHTFTTPGGLVPGTVLLMQNVLLGQTKVMKIRQRETLSHQGAIIHENCCSAAQLQ